MIISICMIAATITMLFVITRRVKHYFGNVIGMGRVIKGNAEDKQHFILLN